MARQILIIQTAFLGDLLLSIPLMKWARRIFQDAEIHLLCREGLGDFFVYQGLVSKIFEVKKNRTESYSEVLAQITSQKYEAILCPHRSFRSARMVAKISAPLKIGFKNWWNLFYFTQRVPFPKQFPDAIRQLSLVSKVNHSESQSLNSILNLLDPKSDLIPDEIDMSWPIRQISFGDELLEQLARLNFVLLAPGSQWKTKRWTKGGYIELARRLKGVGYEVALVGSGTEDLEVNSEICEKVPGSIDLTHRTTLNELAWLMTKSQALVCNDSGLMHLASVVGLPTVAIFGPTTLDLGYKPWQNRAQVVEKNLFCRPCGKHGHNQCPLRTHECMTGITVDKVITAFNKVISKNSPL